MPNLLPAWHFLRPAGRLIWFSIIFVILMIPVIVMMRRPKPALPMTWAQAMGLAVYAFALMLLAYAIIPSEFISFSDKYLQWSKDKYVMKSTTQIPFMHAWNWPTSIDMQSIRDIIVVGIYLVFFAANIAIFSKWQDRKTRTEDDDAKPAVVGRSRFGRPLKAKA